MHTFPKIKDVYRKVLYIKYEDMSVLQQVIEELSVVFKASMNEFEAAEIEFDMNPVNII